MISSHLDFYDDPTGSVLKERLTSIDVVPDFVKTAERLNEEELNKLPDDVFALVAFDEGQKMRKFACVDKGNTALSVIYFMENRDRLPEEAQKTAAANLITACGWYDMAPPEELEKVALVGAAVGALTMASGVGAGHKDYKQRQAAMKAGMPASQAFKLKAGELSGSNLMPYGRETSEKGAKMASLKPHVDITGQQPPPQVEKETGQRYALVKEGEARYPIDTAMQVQRAFTYFEKYASRFTPHERHLYCMKVSNRAGELGLKVPDTIAKYGAATMAEDASVQVYRRQRMFREGTSEHGLLQEMREKCASIKPEVLAMALEKFDREHNLDQLWNNGLDDPYLSIFGIEKVAEYSFVDGNDTITEERLKICGRKCKKQITDLFDEDMAEEFAKDPVQIFDSLPLDSKRIMARLAQQVEE